ncbi:hypothetical protein D8827_00010 [Streptococcus intermedius]|uniref:Uncharacterized protein n=1 Tax=Streptococcus intermedius TaxID=1338 RepID=A0AAE8G140_STRIT|nr:hypothetical protein [Streptococcus intermedius]PMR92912.1 hypothetical protein C1M49_02310 [Streptococcus intermedius]RSJ24153.1 hypothetical protein D8827_00010 [Streptococcus intermedius]
MKVLAITTNFGFGPSSKLVSILKSLNHKENILIDFLGVGNSLDFVSRNFWDINKYIEMDSEQIPGDQLNKLLNQYDLVINVMNLHVQEIMETNDKTKVIFVDSLSWMWPTPIEGITKADLYFIQNYFIDYNKVSNLKNIRVIEPIIDADIETIYTESIYKNNDILVNVSGVFTPNEEDDFGIEFLKYYIGIFKKINTDKFGKVIFACNKNQMDYILKSGIDYSNMLFKIFSRIEFLTCARQSKKVFSTPGLTFYLEASLLQDVYPYYLLPSNYSQVLLLEKYMCDKSRGLKLSDLDGNFIVDKNLDEMLAVQKVRSFLKKAWKYNTDTILHGIHNFLNEEQEASNSQNKTKFLNGSVQLVEILEKEGVL